MSMLDSTHHSHHGKDSVPVIGLTTNLVGPRELGCRRGVDSVAMAIEVQDTVPGVMVGLEEEREGMEDRASGSGTSSGNDAVGEYEDLGGRLGDCLDDEEVDRCDPSFMSGPTLLNNDSRRLQAMEDIEGCVLSEEPIQTNSMMDARINILVVTNAPLCPDRVPTQ